MFEMYLLENLIEKYASKYAQESFLEIIWQNTVVLLQKMCIKLVSIDLKFKEGTGFISV